MTLMHLPRLWQSWPILHVSGSTKPKNSSLEINVTNFYMIKLLLASPSFFSQKYLTYNYITPANFFQPLYYYNTRFNRSITNQCSWQSIKPTQSDSSRNFAGIFFFQLNPLRHQWMTNSSSPQLSINKCKTYQAGKIKTKSYHQGQGKKIKIRLKRILKLSVLSCTTKKKKIWWKCKK